MPTKTKRTKKTAASQIKITVGKTPKYNPLMGVVNTSRYRGVMGTTRHIGTRVTDPSPLCGEAADWGWTASKSEKTHERPMCKKCIKTLKKINDAFAIDHSQVSQEERLEESMKGLRAIIAEYGEWFGEDDDDA